MKHCWRAGGNSTTGASAEDVFFHFLSDVVTSNLGVCYGCWAHWIDLVLYNHCCILHLLFFVCICVTLIYLFGVCWEISSCCTKWPSTGPATPVLTWHGGQQGNSRRVTCQCKHGYQRTRSRRFHEIPRFHKELRPTLEPPWQSFGASTFDHKISFDKSNWNLERNDFFSSFETFKCPLNLRFSAASSIWRLLTG